MGTNHPVATVPEGVVKVPANLSGLPRLSVRAQLALGNALIFGLVLGILAGLLRYGAQIWLATDMDSELAGRARRLAARRPLSTEVRSALEQQRRDSASTANGTTPTEGSVSFPPRLLAPDGSSLYPGGSTSLTGPAWDTNTFARSLRGESAYSFVTTQGVRARVFSTPIIREGKTVGVVQVATSTTEMEQELGRLTRLLLTLIPAALLATLLAGRTVTTRALRPVRDITQAAGRIEARDLSERLPVAGKDELGELALTFNAMLARLEESFAQQRRFTADASHELRTPLAAIKGDVSLALSSGDGALRPAEEYRHALVNVSRAADRMDRIVQDLLLLARSDGHRLPMDLQLLDVNDVLRRAIRSVERAHDGAARAAMELQAVSSGTGTSLSIVGDPHHLERLFVNLLENAVRHTPPEGKITLSARAEGDRILITVTDTGEGISPEHLPHVFESFYRADSARSRDSGGAGLGLAIVRSITEAHGGTVSIESTLGGGTTVFISLPQARLTE
jgi:heavy metal sensor kinase